MRPAELRIHLVFEGRTGYEVVAASTPEHWRLLHWLASPATRERVIAEITDTLERLPLRIASCGTVG